MTDRDQSKNVMGEDEDYTLKWLQIYQMTMWIDKATEKYHLNLQLPSSFIVSAH